MREIKFRAWDKHSRTMEYCGCGDGDFSLLELFFRHNNEHYARYKEHRPTMQFTGLTDKNGKEGYQGDRWIDSGLIYDSEVEWCGEHACNELVLRISGKIVKVRPIAHLPRGKIIGNIYENPELLEG